MSMNKVKRFGTTSREVFYSIPSTGERFTYINAKQLKLNPAVELNGKITKKMLVPNQKSVKEYEYPKKKLIIDRETDIFNNKLTYYNTNTVKPIKSSRFASQDFCETRINYLVYKEPAKLTKVKSSNTFRSEGVDFRNGNSPEKIKSELKRCDLSKHSYTTQIAHLPGAVQRDEKDINDDIRSNRSFDIKRLDRERSKSQDKPRYKTNLKNVPSEIFQSNFDKFLNDKDKLNDNNWNYVGIKNYYAQNKINNKSNGNITSSDMGKKKHIASFKSNSVIFSMNTKQRKSDKDEQRTITGKTIKNIMQMRSQNTPKNVMDNIYNPYQHISHKRTQFGKMNSELIYSSTKNLIN